MEGRQIQSPGVGEVGPANIPSSMMDLQNLQAKASELRPNLRNKGDGVSNPTLLGQCTAV